MAVTKRQADTTELPEAVNPITELLMTPRRTGWVRPGMGSVWSAGFPVAAMPDISRAQRYRAEGMRQLKEEFS